MGRTPRQRIAEPALDSLNLIVQQTEAAEVAQYLLVRDGVVALTFDERLVPVRCIERVLLTIDDRKSLE